MSGRQAIRVIAGAALVVFGAFALLSVATISPYDPPNPDFGPPGVGAVRNLGGVIGAHLAYGLAHALGVSAFLLGIAAVAFGVALVAGRWLEDWPLRLSGTLMLLVGASALAHLTRLAAEGSLAGGGIVGLFAGEALRGQLGAGAYLLSTALVAAGVFLSAEAAAVQTARGAWRLAARLGRMALARARRPEAVAAGGGRARARGGPKIRPKPSRPSAEPKAAPMPPEPAPEPVAAAPAPPAPRAEPKIREKVPAPAGIAEKPAAARETSVRRERRTLESAPSSRRTPYRLPPVDLLEAVDPSEFYESEETVRQRAAVLERTLDEFGIEAQVVEIDRGPVITLYEIEVAAGIKITRVAGLSDDIARALKSQKVRIVAPIPGKSTIGIEVPNQSREIVRLRELMELGVLERKKMTIPLLLGKDTSGAPLVADLAQMPHLLIAGATGSGKSVCINTLILSMLMTQRPDDLKLILVDPKMVELSCYEELPHLLCPVLTDMKRTAQVLEWATIKMDERYEWFAKVGARNLAAYNKLGEKGIRERLHVEPDATLDDVPTHLPIIVIIIDEMADLMMTSAKEAEYAITRLAQKSRAIGIHMIMATQRPSVNVITGLIKANMPSRIAFQTTSMIDSRTILDKNGAEMLLGRGDMLFLPPGTSDLIRGQGAYASDKEIHDIVEFWRAQGRPEYDTELVVQKRPSDVPPDQRDDLYLDAVRVVLSSARGSVSLLQRKLQIGYSRAARLIDMMAEEGLVGEYKGSQAREVLVTLDEWERRNARYLGLEADDDEAAP